MSNITFKNEKIEAYSRFVINHIKKLCESLNHVIHNTGDGMYFIVPSNGVIDYVCEKMGNDVTQLIRVYSHKTTKGNLAIKQQIFGPDVLVPVVGEHLGVTCGNILARSYEILSELKPDGYLVLGDTNSCLSAISAKRLHIPLFHMEAGNRCKDECLPEETNRRIVDVISDVNLPYSEPARKYLHELGMY